MWKWIAAVCAKVRCQKAKQDAVRGGGVADETGSDGEQKRHAAAGVDREGVGLKLPCLLRDTFTM